jgi:hypothetical protein
MDSIVAAAANNRSRCVVGKSDFRFDVVLDNPNNIFISGLSKLREIAIKTS